MGQNIFLQEYFKIILCQLKNILNILVTPLRFELICGNLMEFQKKILKI